MYIAKKQTLIVALIGLVAFTFGACSNSASGPNADSSIAATVNGKNIMLSEVDKIIDQQSKGKQASFTPLQLAQVRIQVLDQLIQKEVLFQRAEREKLLPAPEEVETYIKTQMQESKMTQDDFDKQLKETGQTIESLREETRKFLAIKKLQERTNSKVTVSDKEVDDTFNSNRELFVNKRGVELAMITVDPAANGEMQNDAKSELEAKQKIDQIFQQLKSNADFAEVARAKSEDVNSGVRGGDIGFAGEAELKQNNFPGTLINELFTTLDIGSFTAPVNFSNKWYIFKLKRRQLQDENRNLESPGVRQEINDMLVKQRIEVLNQALMQVAMNEAKITNNLALKMLDSPNNLSGPRPAGQQPAPGAAPVPTPSPSPVASASPSPAASPKKK